MIGKSKVNVITPEKQNTYEELLSGSLNSMYHLGYQLTQNTEETKDLVQEASLRAYRFFDKYEQGTNFKAWILTILRNTFINNYRKKVRQPHKVNYDEVESYVPAPEMSTFEEEVFSEDLSSHIESLPEEMRSVINLYYVEQLSYKEIAKVMDCPLGTVMSRLYMSKQLLKKKLSKSVHQNAK